ncbi:MAG: acetate/propionate family kinase [Anaerolineae bacterium]|nr:acetate/propionate family kinase [Anaerolineae bacterium]
MNILVLNPGSSTLKFGVYQMPDLSTASATRDSATVLVSGIIERIGTPQAELTLSAATRQVVSEMVEALTTAQAVEQIIRRILAYAGENAPAALTIDAVGCRVVHGGARSLEPTRVTPSVLDELRALGSLAPLHNPVDVAVLEQVQRSLPETPVLAVFDTEFHQTLPPVAYTYALPFELCARYGLRRYGFHGISHAYVSRQLIGHLGRGARGTKVVTCHLGNGTSICALADGKSVDISSGFTPLEGLVMGTRSGDVDPGLILYLIRTVGMSASEVDSLLNRDSGLRGLSGLSADVRDLEQAALDGNEHAKLALEIFVYRARKYTGAYAAALAGLDAVAFTGGIGQHSASMRSRICQGLDFLGLRLDEARNKTADGHADVKISAQGSPAQIWVIPTDEEQEISWSTVEAIRRKLS